MCRLVNLQELDIKNNRLTSLPKDIGKCRFLRILALSNNNLKELPSTIGQLSLLEELNLQ
jgi:Leucine-rich repeat (LRR) protein